MLRVFTTSKHLNIKDNVCPKEKRTTASYEQVKGWTTHEDPHQTSEDEGKQQSEQQASLHGKVLLCTHCIEGEAKGNSCCNYHSQGDGCYFVLGADVAN